MPTNDKDFNNKAHLPKDGLTHPVVHTQQPSDPSHCEPHPSPLEVGLPLGPEHQLHCQSTNKSVSTHAHQLIPKIE